MSCQASGLTGDGAHIRCGLPRADTAAEWRVVASAIGIADHCAGTHWCAIVTSRCRERRASVVARPVRSTARVAGRSERVSDLVPTCKRTHLAVVARLALTTAGSIAGRAVCTLDPAIHGLWNSSRRMGRRTCRRTGRRRGRRRGRRKRRNRGRVVVLAVGVAVALVLRGPASELGRALVSNTGHAVVVEETALRFRIVEGDLAPLVGSARAAIRVRFCCGGLDAVVGLVPEACRGTALCRVGAVCRRCVSPDSGIRFGVVSLGPL